MRLLNLVFSAALGLGALSGSLAQARQHIIISDIDDTVKHTDVGDHSDAIGNALFNRTGFPGMAELYAAIRRGDGDAMVRIRPTDLVFVSGSPALLEEAIHDFLDINGFTLYQVFTRHLHNWTNTRDFKINTLRQLLGRLRAADAEVFLIGDDTQQDAEVYRVISQEHPELIGGTYIREVRHEAGALDGQLGFHSAADIGIDLLLREQIRAEDVSRVLGAFYDRADREFLGEAAFPEFAQCPWAPDWLTRTWGESLKRRNLSAILEQIRNFEQEVEIHCTYR